MTEHFRTHLRGAAAAAAIVAGLALAGCNPQGGTGRDQAAYQLPALPATLPLAPGGTTEPAHAPAAALLPASRRIGTARVADPRDDYAYADDASGFADALGDAPPDYGFYYDDVEPWAWQGYDNSIEFVEPLSDGYRYYYYRPGADSPYFVRDPSYGYGYDGGRLAVVYGPDGSIIPDGDYGPRLDYASRYYARGRALYGASRERRPVIAANWAARQKAIVDARRWAAERAAQPSWQEYHQRTAPQQARHWDEEQARRRADAVRFAAWQGNDFSTPPPPRAIPPAWTRASWAHDDRRFAPPAPGFDGDAAARQRAAQKERDAIMAQARQPQRRPQDMPLPPGARPGINPNQQQPQPQPVTGGVEGPRRPLGPDVGYRPGADMAAHQQAVRAQQAAQQQQDQARRQQMMAQQAAAQQQQNRAAALARQAQLRDAAQARERAQNQVRAQQAAQQQAQARQRGEAQQRVQAEQRQAQQRVQAQAEARQRQAVQAQQRAQAQAQAQQRQAIQAQQRQAAQAQAEARQRQAVQAQQRAQAQAQAQQRQAIQAQQRQAAQAQAQAQQRQAAQAQQRAAIQARQRPPAPPVQPHPAPVLRSQPSAPAGHPTPEGHRHEPH
ncbi:hypothetical protein GCM10009087_01620 [Sphingomonas oligophenolica]|uniref:Uncharacterized protein n=1 Tax=Sphingomonas oligophenolica TaxID=301154 RepID=A0ABU9Y134_9SPHN